MESTEHIQTEKVTELEEVPVTTKEEIKPVDVEAKKKETKRLERILIWSSVIFSNGAIIFAALGLLVSTLISIVTLIVANTLEKTIIEHYFNTTTNSTLLSTQNTTWATWVCIVGFILEFITIFCGLMA